MPNDKRVDFKTTPQDGELRQMKTNIIKSSFAKKIIRIVSTQFIKITFITFILISLFLITFLLYKKYQMNYSEAGILNRAYINMSKSKNISYDGSININFSMDDRSEKISLNELEIYSLLRRSVSESHEMIVSGEHIWSGTKPVGTYNLVWNISNNKIFGLEGYYEGSDVYYKAEAYVYTDAVNDELKENYSKVNISELFSKIITDDNYLPISDVRAENFKADVVQTLPEDLIDGVKSHHFKIKISEKEGNNRLIDALNIKDLDLWIDKVNYRFRRLKGRLNFTNVGGENNDIEVSFDLKLNSK